MLLTVSNLKKSYVQRLLFEDVSFEVAERDHIGLVGVNGCGKTTLLRILMGREEPDTGEVYISRNTVVSYMEQMKELSLRTLYEGTLETFQQLMRMEEELEEVNELLLRGNGEEQLIRRQHQLQTRFEQEGGLTYRSRTRSMLLGLGFSENELDQPLSTMSGGQLSKAQLAKVLLSGANLLLLDEPTNHLDIDAVQFLEDTLLNYQGAYIVISHDRYFLDRVTSRTFELKNQRLITSAGNYSRHVELRSTEREIAMRQYQRACREIRRVEAIVQQQRRWGQAHNFITAASKQKQADRLRAQLVKPEQETARIHFHFQTKETICNDVLSVQGLSKAFEGKRLFEHVDFLIKKGERVFLLGPNGCGKTTLFKLLMGELAADAGKSGFGAKIQPGYYEQNMSALNPEKTALQEVYDAYPRKNIGELRNALAAFLFRGDDVDKPIGTLSGGEMARIQLLKLMLSGANLLLLDEPTNHLDIDSREALEQALEEYQGTIFAITHDRYLINRLADRVLYLSRDGMVEFLGGYDDFLEQRAGANQQEQASQSKEAKPNAYKAQKERQSAINRATGAVRRSEERIAAAEIEISAMEETLMTPEYALDYQKAGALAKKIETRKTALEDLYFQWEQDQAALEELEQEGKED